MDFVTANNITTMNQFLTHLPLHMKKHYSFIKNTGALNVTSLQNPGLLTWGSDARFMMNIGSAKGTPLYDVIDMAALQPDGDWEFRSLDFRGATPVLTPNGGNNGECRDCHGIGGVSGTGSMRPILGNYLFWDGFFSNSNDASGEAVTTEEKPVLDSIKGGQHNMDRFHSILFGDYLYAEIGTANMLPNHAYGPGLTIFNTEMGAAVTESVHKRISRSPNYRGLREEMLALSYCDGKNRLSTSQKNAIISLVESKGGSPNSFLFYNSWAGVYQAMGLEPLHEFPLHKRTKDSATIIERDDLNWSTGVSPVRESVDFLILMELAQENSQIASMLNSAQPSYPMTGGCSFPTLKDHFDHKKYAMYTLYGNARQKARESYYDIDYHRMHLSMNYIAQPLCSLLTSNIGAGTIGSTITHPDLLGTRNSGQVGQYISGGPSSGEDGMALYTFDNDLGSNGSNCNGTCSAAWPPLLVSNASHVTGPSGVGTYGSVARNDGKLQVTFNGRPVYFYATDEKPGDTRGHGVGGVWKLAATSSGTNPNTPPVANANGPYSASVNNNISFSSQGSNDSNGTINNYRWEFGDGATSSQPDPVHSYTSAGTFSVRLTVTDNEGATGTSSTTATITGGSTGSIVANPNGPYTGVVGSTVNFSSAGSDSPDGGIVEQEWDFGDGIGSSTAANPSYTYSTAGTYTVTLLVIDGIGAEIESTTTATITSGGTINNPPTANANGPYSGNVNSSISFSSQGSTDNDGNITTFNWDFGDGTSSNQPNPSHIYTNSGSYSAKLTVTDNDGAKGISSATVTVNGGSSGSITANPNGPYTGSVGNAVSFSSAGSSSPDGGIVEQEWDFGDGNGSSTAANPSYTYSAPGNYSVTLLVVDALGAEAESTTTATITTGGTPNTPPTANANGPYSGRINTSISFSSQGSSDTDGTIVSYEWTFGDGGRSSAQTPSYAYSTAGSFTATLTVTDNKGATGRSNATVTVTNGGTNTPPIANVHGPYSGNTNSNIPFSSSGSHDPDGTISTYTWDFGDGATSNTRNPAHAYTTAGTYNVTLTVTDNGGLSTEARTTATITDGGATVLGNGVPITGISGAQSSEKGYYIHIHGTNPSNLNINISGGTGDADIYIKQGSMPTRNVYDCQSGKAGNSESCTIASPAHGPYYIMIYAYNAYSGVTLSGTYDEGNATQELVMIHNSSQHGDYLAGGPSSGKSGMSLYVFDDDQGSGGSACNGGCASTWPPLTVNNTGEITGPAGLNLGSITRNDGSTQVTLDGRPVYFYAGDNAKGDTAGHGLSNTWWVAKTGGTTNPTPNEYGLYNACANGRTPMANMNISLGASICTQDAGSGQVNFKYTPTASDVGKDLLFTVGHGNGVAGLTANQDLNRYATEADFNANPGVVFGSFGLDPLNRNNTYNRVIVTNVQAGKDIWLSMNAGSGGFSGVSLKGEVIEPVNLSTLTDACAAGSPPITDQYVNLGQAVCGKSSPGKGHYTHFIYRPTAAEAGKSFVLEMAYGTGQASMTANQHYSSAPTSGGTGFAHEEHLADRPDLVFSSFRTGTQQRIIYPDAAAGRDILVVIPPGAQGFSNITFRINVLP